MDKAIQLVDQLHKSSNHSTQFEFLISLVSTSFEESVKNNILKMVYELELKQHEIFLTLFVWFETKSKNLTAFFSPTPPPPHEIH